MNRLLIAIALLVLTGCVTRVYVVPCPQKSVGTCNQEQCSVDSLYALIRMQNRHIEKLQAKLPRPSLSDVPLNRVREG